MNTLKGLKPEARPLVSDEAFRRGDIPRLDVSSYLVEDLGLGRQIDLAPIRAVIERAMTRKPRESDPWLGPRIHATLRLTRREAADKRIWEYLTTIEFPEYVRWRWKNPEGNVPIDRFLGEDSKNALARLWWAAELTRNGSDYKPAVQALSISRFSVSWLHLILIHHRPAALAVVDFLSTYGNDGATDTQGQVMAKAVNIALRTLAIDSKVPNPVPDAEAIREWCEEHVDETKIMDELPRGPDEEPVPTRDIQTIRAVLDTLAERIKLTDVKFDRRPLDVSG